MSLKTTILFNLSDVWVHLRCWIFMYPMIQGFFTSPPFNQHFFQPFFEQSSSWELSENTPLNVAFSQTEKQDKCCATLTLIYVNSEISPFEFYKNFVSSPGYWCIWACLFQRDPFKWQLGHICFAESILSQIWKIGVCGTTLDSKAQRKDQSQVLYNIYLIWNFKLNLC